MSEEAAAITVPAEKVQRADCEEGEQATPASTSGGSHDNAGQAAEGGIPLTKSQLKKQRCVPFFTLPPLVDPQRKPPCQEPYFAPYFIRFITMRAKCRRLERRMEAKQKKRDNKKRKKEEAREQRRGDLQDQLEALGCVKCPLLDYTGSPTRRLREKGQSFSVTAVTTKPRKKRCWRK